MNEPIISPWLFYIASCVDAIKFGAGFLDMVLCIASVLGLFIWFNEHPSDQEKKGIKIILKMTIVFFLIACLVPSSRTVYQMAIAQQITPANIQAVGEKVDKSVDKIIDKVINCQIK